MPTTLQLQLIFLSSLLLTLFSFPTYSLTLSPSIMSTSLKTVKQIVAKPNKHWVGDAFNVYPVFGNKAFTFELSPFLMFDFMDPKHFPPTPDHRRSVGQHPHRGFETITIAFQGEIEHGDSLKNRGVIKAGDVQWMTAAKGIVHEEFHSVDFSKTGGTMSMAQIWLNLPAKDKMNPPRYQPILSTDMTFSPLYSYTKDSDTCVAADPADGSVKVIAGEFFGVKGPAMTHTQVDMWDISIDDTTGKEFQFDTVEGNNVIVFVRGGEIEVQGKRLGPADVAIMNKSFSKIVLSTLNNKPAQVLLLAGMPIDEPIAAQGPFVMNTREEIMQANMDYRSGKNGFEGSDKQF